MYQAIPLIISALTDQWLPFLPIRQVRSVCNVFFEGRAPVFAEQPKHPVLVNPDFLR